MKRRLDKDPQSGRTLYLHSLARLVGVTRHATRVELPDLLQGVRAPEPREGSKPLPSPSVRLGSSPVVAGEE